MTGDLLPVLLRAVLLSGALLAAAVLPVALGTLEGGGTMRRLARLLGRLGFGVVVLGALAFGATQALGTTGQRECSLCDYPDSRGLCQSCCEELDFPNGTCFPSGNCICW
jgi:hypothetical protein